MESSLVQVLRFFITFFLAQSLFVSSLKAQAHLSDRLEPLVEQIMNEYSLAGSMVGQIEVQWESLVDQDGSLRRFNDVFEDFLQTPKGLRKASDWNRILKSIPAILQTEKSPQGRVAVLSGRYLGGETLEYEGSVFSYCEAYLVLLFVSVIQKLVFDEADFEILEESLLSQRPLDTAESIEALSSFSEIPIHALTLLSRMRIYSSIWEAYLRSEEQGLELNQVIKAGLRAMLKDIWFVDNQPAFYSKVMAVFALQDESLVLPKIRLLAYRPEYMQALILHGYSQQFLQLMEAALSRFPWEKITDNESHFEASRFFQAAEAFLRGVLVGPGESFPNESDFRALRVAMSLWLKEHRALMMGCLGPLREAKKASEY